MRNGLRHGMTVFGPMIKTRMTATGTVKNCTARMSMVISTREKAKEKERKARKARMMKAKEENQEMEKENPTIFNPRPHQLLPCRINNNKLITLQQHQAQGTVLFHFLRLALHVWMFWQPPMKSASTRDALVGEDKTKVMKRHGRTEKEPRGFLFWLEKLEHFSQHHNADQHQCPEKLVYRRMRLHGSHRRKALHFSCQGTLKTQRYQLV